eukprot:3215560-Pleurochrysis_carterae.AAC.5
MIDELWTAVYTASPTNPPRLSLASLASQPPPLPPAALEPVAKVWLTYPFPTRGWRRNVRARQRKQTRHARVREHAH